MQLLMKCLLMKCLLVKCLLVKCQGFRKAVERFPVIMPPINASFDRGQMLVDMAMKTHTHPYLLHTQIHAYMRPYMTES